MSIVTVKVLDNAKLDKIIELLNNIGVKMAEQQAEIDLLTAQVTKVHDEVIQLKATLEASIADLEDQIANGTAVDLTALREAIDSIDSIMPDAVV